VQLLGGERGEAGVLAALQEAHDAAIELDVGVPTRASDSSGKCESPPVAITATFRAFCHDARDVLAGGRSSAAPAQRRHEAVDPEGDKRGIGRAP